MTVPLRPVPRSRPTARRAAGRLSTAGLALAAMLVGGCASTQSLMPSLTSFAVYKIDINQGNYLSQDMVDRLKTGMTRQQVKQTLGTPLVTSAFRDNRWDYVYEYAHQGKVRERRQFTVFFTEDKLARWSGDELPTSAAELNRTAAEKSLARESEDESRFTRWIRGIFGK